jgi:hypothetical protein
MNWINDLASRKTDQEYCHQEHYDEDLGVMVSERGSALGALEDWLSLEYWNFNLGSNQFDGYSEGLCLLAGIDPEQSMLTAVEYGPKFLANSIQFYGYEKITFEEQGHLRDAVDRHIDNLKSLGFSGRVHCHHALKTCAQYKLDPPWLEAANKDFKCAKMLPFKLRTDAEIIRRIGRVASSRGGRMRANKSAKTNFLNTQGLAEFQRLSQEGFPSCRATTSDRIIATEVADKIYQVLSRTIGEQTEILPELTTVQSSVRKWLKNLAK